MCDVSKVRVAVGGLAKDVACEERDSTDVGLLDGVLLEGHRAVCTCTHERQSFSHKKTERRHA